MRGRKASQRTRTVLSSSCCSCASWGIVCARCLSAPCHSTPHLCCQTCVFPRDDDVLQLLQRARREALQRGSSSGSWRQAGAGMQVRTHAQCGETESSDAWRWRATALGRMTRLRHVGTLLPCLQAETAARQPSLGVLSPAATSSQPSAQVLQADHVTPPDSTPAMQQAVGEAEAGSSGAAGPAAGPAGGQADGTAALDPPPQQRLLLAIPTEGAAEGSAAAEPAEEQQHEGAEAARQVQVQAYGLEQPPSVLQVPDSSDQLGVVNPDQGVSARGSEGGGGGVGGGGGSGDNGWLEALTEAIDAYSTEGAAREGTGARGSDTGAGYRADVGGQGEDGMAAAATGHEVWGDTLGGTLALQQPSEPMQDAGEQDAQQQPQQQPAQQAAQQLRQQSPEAMPDAEQQEVHQPPQQAAQQVAQMLQHQPEQQLVVAGPGMGAVPYQADAAQVAAHVPSYLPQPRPAAPAATVSATVGVTAATAATAPSPSLEIDLTADSDGEKDVVMVDLTSSSSPAGVNGGSALRKRALQEGGEMVGKWAGGAGDAEGGGCRALGNGQ